MCERASFLVAVGLEGIKTKQEMVPNYNFVIIFMHENLPVIREEPFFLIFYFFNCDSTYII